ncbi:hypothetical protein ACFL3G_04285 [Planctomycetota bacterium]
MKRIVLLLLFAALLFLPACAKIGLKDPMTIPGLGEELNQPAKNTTVPKFNNGDTVVYKMLGDKRGIMMNNSYKYLPPLKAWYCIVDFYPSTAMHVDFSKFDNYERRYVYEFELQSISQYVESQKNELVARAKAEKKIHIAQDRAKKDRRIDLARRRWYWSQIK